ncbi:ATP-dependent RNA helicase DDX25 [Pteropus alecto]|uniref:ATP-dependent RNA helicase n=1 Tax=Pteropus alecto TaxID=9402 RepID=L5KDL0_PTEAL|nr:ATP-dependent RNA helicase DDX25 [Pteropus alecto]
MTINPQLLSFHLSPNALFYPTSLIVREELLKGIYAMGFNRPSKIQEMALPMMLAYPPQNLIAQSQSGTGKTAAFVLAMLSRVNALELFPQPGGAGHIALCTEVQLITGTPRMLIPGAADGSGREVPEAASQETGRHGIP